METVQNLFYTVTYVDPADYRTGRDSAEFYVWGNDPSHVATVVSNEHPEREIRIHTNGEMRLHVWESAKDRTDGVTPKIARYSDVFTTWSGLGILNDEDLAKALEEDRAELGNNPWFELSVSNSIYDVSIEVIDLSLEGAVAQAGEIVISDTKWEEVGKWVGQN